MSTLPLLIEPDLSAERQPDGRVLVRWNWFKEYVDAEEAAAMRDMLTAALVGPAESTPDCDEFLRLYPYRNPKRKQQAVARRCWAAMGKIERGLLMKAVKNYARDQEAKTGIGVPDIHRWMGFTRAAKRIKTSEPPYIEWASVSADAPPRPEVGPYAVYKPYDDSCPYCKGAGMVSVKMKKARGYTEALRCCCKLGDSRPGRKFDPKRDEVA